MRKPWSRLGAGLSRQSERRHLKDALSGDTQRLAAGGKETNPPGFLQDDIGKDGDGVQEMLAVVEDQKGLAGGEVGDQERGWPLSRRVRQAQAGYHGLGNQMRILEAC